MKKVLNLDFCTSVWDGRGAVWHQIFRSASFIQYSQDLKDCLLLALVDPANPFRKTILALVSLLLLALTPELAAQNIDLKDRNAGPADVSIALASWIDLEAATTKQPESLTAWFGMNGEELKRRYAANGSAVTAFKRATRMGNTRFTARALDDRAGSTALVLAARRIVPSNLKRRVIFAWSVREETGLEGGRRLRSNTVLQ